ncbi:aspartyl/asparaginyl beta-hydroxylase domain-containing protein [Micromonospora craterilacus]|uniref:Aspartyl/asparaginyl beta-hydroxylase domain-containing protein n=2 Tax=Micromonospora craterilacus TaxID=1655439 RepID=A0A2W2FCM2_9ACTN|nr:aspartyl/asparaginyl beta-hydroxylase domain-containing protein [Micromonospora craterilacus]
MATTADPQITMELRRRYAALIDAMLREDRPDLVRATAELAVGQGVWADPLQRPVDYLPDGSGRPVYDPDDFWFVAHLEASYPAISAEVESVMADGRTGFAPVDEPLLGSGRWEQVVLYEAGRRQEQACALFPATAAALAQIPEATTFGPGVATLSWLEPGSHVLPHCGRTNAQLRVHLGLRTPPGPVIRVGNERLTWQEGRCIVFDDSFEHEVWHTGTEPRLVLLLDVMYPGLSPAGRARTLARRATTAEQIAAFLAEHDLDRVETDERGVVMRPAPGTEALVRRYLSETGASAVERRGRTLSFAYPGSAAPGQEP